MQRLFLKEKDNQHEEPLLFAQYALQQLHDLLSSQDLSPDIASIVTEWVKGISQVLPCRLLCLLQCDEQCPSSKLTRFPPYNLLLCQMVDHCLRMPVPLPCRIY